MSECLHGIDLTRDVVVPKATMDEIHTKVVALINDTGYMTRNEIARTFSNIAYLTGAYATRPTDIASHRTCTLSVSVTEEQTFPDVRVDREDERTLLMPDPSRIEHADVLAVTRIWCVDHERELEADTLNRFDLEWS